MDEGDWEQATDHFRRIIEEEAHRIGEMTSYDSKERQRKAAALANKGLIAEFQGRDEQAAELFDRALDISGGSVSIWAHRDRVGARKEDYVDLNAKVKAAEESFRRQQKEVSPPEDNGDTAQ